MLLLMRRYSPHKSRDDTFDDTDTEEEGPEAGTPATTTTTTTRGRRDDDDDDISLSLSLLSVRESILRATYMMMTITTMAKKIRRFFPETREREREKEEEEEDKEEKNATRRFLFFSLSLSLSLSLSNERRDFLSAQQPQRRIEKKENDKRRLLLRERPNNEKGAICLSKHFSNPK